MNLVDRIEIERIAHESCPFVRPSNRRHVRRAVLQRARLRGVSRPDARLLRRMGPRQYRGRVGQRPLLPRLPRRRPGARRPHRSHRHPARVHRLAYGEHGCCVRFRRLCARVLDGERVPGARRRGPRRHISSRHAPTGRAPRGPHPDSRRRLLCGRLRNRGLGVLSVGGRDRGPVRLAVGLRRDRPGPAGADRDRARRPQGRRAAGGSRVAPPVPQLPRDPDKSPRHGIRACRCGAPVGADGGPRVVRHLPVSSRSRATAIPRRRGAPPRSP